MDQIKTTASLKRANNDPKRGKSCLGLEMFLFTFFLYGYTGKLFVITQIIKTESLVNIILIFLWYSPPI